jgi:hypothetical protein
MAIFHIRAIDGESDEGAHFMPAFFARRTGIHVQAVDLIVVNDLQDMGMAIDEQLGRISCQLLFNGRVVSGRVAADMGHVHFHVLAFPAQLFRVHAADLITVDIPIHTFERFKGFQVFRYLQGAEIARMPDLIAGDEVFEYRRVEVTMGVGDQANARHAAKINGTVQQYVKPMKLYVNCCCLCFNLLLCAPLSC